MDCSAPKSFCKNSDNDFSGEAVNPAPYGALYCNTVWQVLPEAGASAGGQVAKPPSKTAGEQEGFLYRFSPNRAG